MSALDNQIGGSHYKSGYQPVELFARLSLNAFQANIIKYLSRFKRKNGREDLEKAMHYTQLMGELQPLSIIGAYPFDFWWSELESFIKANGIEDDTTIQAMIAVVKSDCKEAERYIKILILLNYGER